MLTQLGCFDESLFSMGATVLIWIFVQLSIQIMTTTMTGFQMLATWWNRLEVNVSNLVEQAWSRCKQPGWTGFMLGYPWFGCLTNIFSQWEQLNCLSLLWACSCWLNLAASMNVFSQFEQLNGFYLNICTTFYTNYDNNDRVSNASNLMEQAWSKCKQHGGTGLM